VTITPAPIEVVQRFLEEVMNGGRPVSAPELIDSEPLLQRVEVLRSAFADLHVRAVRTIAQDGLVAVHLVASGTHTGPFQGASPTGRAWASSCTALYQIEHGRIVDFWVNWDTLDIAEQLGIVRRAAGASA
jgi:predicted ester cyclase